MVAFKAAAFAFAVFTASVIAGAALAKGSHDASTDRSALLSGQTFRWSLSGAPAAAGQQCTEDWRFGADGVAEITSGREHVTTHFVLRAIPSEPMLELTETRLSMNGEPDCRGVVNTGTGQRTRIYLMFLNGGGFFTCSSTDTLSCFGVASPMTPP